MWRTQGGLGTVMLDKLLIYGLTRFEGHEQVMEIKRTFEKALFSPIVWYSDAEDDRFHPRISVT